MRSTHTIAQVQPRDILTASELTKVRHFLGDADNITVRAEDAAIPRLRLEHRSTALALIKVLARVLGHDLGLAMPAGRTRDRRPHLHPILPNVVMLRAHSPRLSCGNDESPTWAQPRPWCNPPPNAPVSDPSPSLTRHADQRGAHRSLYSTMSCRKLSMKPSTCERSSAGTANLSSVTLRWFTNTLQSSPSMPIPRCEVFMSRPT